MVPRKVLTEIFAQELHIVQRQLLAIRTERLVGKPVFPLTMRGLFLVPELLLLYPSQPLYRYMVEPPSRRYWPFAGEEAHVLSITVRSMRMLHFVLACHATEYSHLQ